MEKLYTWFQFLKMYFCNFVNVKKKFRGNFNSPCVTEIRSSNVCNGFPNNQPKSLNLVLNGEGVELLSSFEEDSPLWKTIKYGKNLTKNVANAILVKNNGSWIVLNYDFFDVDFDLLRDILRDCDLERTKGHTNKRMNTLAWRFK